MNNTLPLSHFLKYSFTHPVMENCCMISKRNFLVLCVFMLVLLSGCQSSGSPSDAVLDYLQAVIDGDWVQAVNLSCAAWEQGARTEANSFDSIEAYLEGVSCSAEETEGDTRGVTCQGVIVATYGAEDRQLALEGRTYQIVLEGGEWRMCGYQ
jgi:hypothetical protein